MKSKYLLYQLILLSYSFICVAPAQAQDIQLPEVTVYGIPTEKYAAGAKIYKVDSLSLQQHKQGSLTDILTRRTALYMKNYGNGMASTIAFRGTSPNHTAVLWNGFNINQPTLGQTDFSIVPLTAFNQLSVQYGSASSLFGSDAIGGSIYLHAQPTWKQGLAIRLNQEVASFGTSKTQLAATYSNKNLETRTSGYYTIAENDFPYRNTSRAGAPIEKQDNAGISQQGFTQDMYYKFSSNRYVAIKSWYNSSQRNLQPIIGIKNNDESQLDQNLRLAAEYHQQTGLGYTTARAGFIHDLLLYKKPSQLIDSRSLTSKFIARLEHEVTIRSNMSVKAGAEVMEIQADVDGYNRRITQTRADLYVLFRYRIIPRWLTTLTVRQAFVQGYQPPVAPSVGSEYILWQPKDNYILTFKTSFSRSYRVPTLNERYWNPGGNLDLQPEDAIGGEAGMAFTINKKNIRSQTEITHYQNSINHLIQWQPGLENSSSVWSPRNLQLVYNRGLEVSSSLQADFKNFQIETGLQYAYTRSTQEKVNNSNDKALKGKQLMYVPFHNGIWYGNIHLKDWLIGANASYTSYRYTNSSNSNQLDSFALVDLMAGRTFSLSSCRFHLSAKINNLFNTNYQTIEARAMPGRNYAISINFHFQTNPASKP